MRSGGMLFTPDRLPEAAGPAEWGTDWCARRGQRRNSDATASCENPLLEVFSQSGDSSQSPYIGPVWRIRSADLMAQVIAMASRVV